MTFFFGKNFHFHGQNFWWPFFSHRLGFSDFPFLFPEDFPYLYYVKCRIWPFPHKKNHYFRKEFLYDAFFHSVRTFARIPQHYFSKYWGDGCMGRPPTSNVLGGPSPHSPYVSAPALYLVIILKRMHSLFGLDSISILHLFYTSGVALGSQWAFHTWKPYLFEFHLFSWTFWYTTWHCLDKLEFSGFRYWL